MKSPACDDKSPLCTCGSEQDGKGRLYGTRAIVDTFQCIGPGIGSVYVSGFALGILCR